MSIVAGADFGTLSARVSLCEKGTGRIGSGTAEYPVNRSAHNVRITVTVKIL